MMLLRGIHKGSHTSSLVMTKVTCCCQEGENQRVGKRTEAMQVTTKNAVQLCCLA
jgi:hypothetical protein